METMMSSIEQRNTDDVLTPVEELQMEETIELYPASLPAYKSMSTLLMIYQMEQSGLEYQFIYDIKADRDFLQKEYEWRK